MLRLLEVPRPRRYVVAPQVGRRLLVPDPVGAWEHGQASRDAPLALFHEPLGLRALLGTRALAHRAAVHVILHPPDVSRCAIPRLLFVQGPHQLSPFSRRPGGFGTGRDWFERPCRAQGRDAWMSCRPPDIRCPRCTGERCPGRSTGSRLPSGLPDIDETVELQFVEE